MLLQQVLVVCLLQYLVIATVIPSSHQNNDYTQAEQEYAADGNTYVDPPSEVNAGEGSPATNGDDNDASPGPPTENEGADDDQPGEQSAKEDADSDSGITIVGPIDEPTADPTKAGGDNDEDNDDETETPDSDGNDGDATTESSSTNDDDGDDNDEIISTSHSASCSNPKDGFKDTISELSGKIEQLIGVIDHINGSIERMETLVQSTIVDERLYKCISAINNGNQSQALKYWKQILRYQSDTSKRSSIIKQIIKGAHAGKEESLLHIIKFIDATQEYYGYETLFEELKSFNQLYHHKSVFTLAHYIIKGCGRKSELFNLMPAAVQSINSKFFTLQSKFNKGYLYYAKRCVARHYHYCLDVLTKLIDTQEMKYLDAEEKGRYHWKLTATDDTVTNYFIVNDDKYWSYRLQDVNNSPRFKMEETGNNFEIELSHFQLELSTDDEIAIEIRETNTYLEGEEFKLDNKSEVLLHSFHKSDTASSSNRMNWLVQAVDDVITDGDLADNENCKIVSNGNGNGNNGGR